MPVMRAFNQRVTDDGRRVVDLMDSTGAVIRGAPTLSGVALPLTVPLEAEVALEDYSYLPYVLVLTDPGMPKPVVVGVMDNGQVLFSAGDGAPEHTGGMDNPGDADDPLDQTRLEDAMIATPGATMALRYTGEMVLAGTQLSVQVPRGGSVRMSEGGDTSERVPLAGALLAYIRELRAAVVTLHEAVRDIQAEIRLARPLTPARGDALVSVAGVVSGTLGPALLHPGPYPATATIPDFDEETLTAAILRISSRSEDSDNV